MPRTGSRMAQRYPPGVRPDVALISRKIRATIDRTVNTERFSVRSFGAERLISREPFCKSITGDYKPISSTSNIYKQLHSYKGPIVCSFLHCQPTQLSDAICHRFLIRRNMVFGYLAALHVLSARLLGRAVPRGYEIRIIVEPQEPQDTVSH